jgi:hypothetical protein
MANGHNLAVNSLFVGGSPDPEEGSADIKEECIQYENENYSQNGSEASADDNDPGFMEFGKLADHYANVRSHLTMN